ncbi:MAG: septal ring lytic transglycosylase RlpA family protein [Calditrichaeota bacterium]|nr:septal ring lytic transglycosylase RlpA family protein [Candidatus Cloacimonadota bacterium]MCB1045652.1 septal ring lytic transglycosylase RlpA family protein [Calditrichota bacterium]MCB9474634.1 septal ring lytic transglycosylase RlpA family protein [Candidatus Delongbacteria bacterium]
MLRRDSRLAPRIALVLLLALGLFGCSSNPRFVKHDGVPAAKVSPPEQEGWQVGQVLRGTSSWYGKQFHGRPTASGEIFNQDDMTAAHRSLPLGTWVQVTNMANGHKAEVKINDRGPFVGDRVLDCSRAAARRLAFINQGTTEVEIRILSLP